MIINPPQFPNPSLTPPRSCILSGHLPPHIASQQPELFKKNMSTLDILKSWDTPIPQELIDDEDYLENVG
jgi:hypothetical protein